MTKIETIISLAKRRGFVYPGSEIYGGLAGTWDYGPLGVLLKNNIKNEWWKALVESREDIFGLDSSIVLNSEVWKASGHLEQFSDPLIECKSCKKKFRKDDVSENKCPECGGSLGEVRQFNLMFRTFIGAAEDTSSQVYLRPETAQGIFINFKNIIDSFHPKLPFGIAQLGRAFRNEITPRNFLFRMREFEQMELEYFVKPEESEKFHKYWREERFKWYLELGIKKDNLGLRDYKKEELAHYSSTTTDIEYKFGLSEKEFDELEGIANRTDFDLKNHSKFSGAELKYYDEKTKESFYPYIIEPSAGVDRAFLAFLMDAYCEDELNEEKRVVLKLHPKIAPVKVAVFPLLANKPELVKKAREVYKLLKEFSIFNFQFSIAWDDIGNIGKRYRRQDEIGTPWCVTVDFDTLKDNTVTIRDRDTAKQERVAILDVISSLKEKLK